jgi:uncharacterized protein YhhL (DUF1145 family)
MQRPLKVSKINQGSIIKQNRLITDIVLIGKAATLSMWTLFTYSCVIPFDPGATALLLAVASITALMHTLLLLLVLAHKSLRFRRHHYVAILCWGIFGLISPTETATTGNV